MNGFFSFLEALMAANVSCGSPSVNGEVNGNQMCMKANSMSQGHLQEVGMDLLPVETWCNNRKLGLLWM